MSPQAVPPSTVTEASDLTSILQLRGADFVRCAYLTILKREADPDGLRNYLKLLREGLSKTEVLIALYNSREASEVGRDIAWMRPVLRLQRLSSIPVVGTIVRSFSIKESKASLSLRLRVLQEKLDYLESQSDASSQTPDPGIRETFRPGTEISMSNVAQRVLRQFCAALSEASSTRADLTERPR